MNAWRVGLRSGLLVVLCVLPARSSLASTYLTAPRPMGLPMVAPLELEPEVCDGSPGLSVEELMAYVERETAAENAIVRELFLHGKSDPEGTMVALQRHMSRLETLRLLVANLAEELAAAAKAPPMEPCGGAVQGSPVGPREVRVSPDGPHGE